jgi:hypothetical protein
MTEQTTITVEEARLRAHEPALATDATYRLQYEAYAQWCERRKAEQQARRAARAVRMLRVRVTDPLPLARVWMRGPRWKRAFGLQHLAYSHVNPPSAEHQNPTDKMFWWYDFEDDVRELVLEELRPGVVAQWSDPRERIG